jgi:N-acetylglucosamine kinase-like BadF-type ATPase
MHDAVLHTATESERVERGFAAEVAQDARLCGQGGGDGDQGALVILGYGKVGVEELGDLDVVGGQS